MLQTFHRIVRHCSGYWRNIFYHFMVQGCLIPTSSRRQQSTSPSVSGMSWASMTHYHPRRESSETSVWKSLEIYEIKLLELRQQPSSVRLQALSPIHFPQMVAMLWSEMLLFWPVWRSPTSSQNRLIKEPELVGGPASTWLIQWLSVMLK